MPPSLFSVTIKKGCIVKLSNMFFSLNWPVWSCKQGYFDLRHEGMLSVWRSNLLKLWFFSYLSLGCSKELSHWDGSFEYPQHTFWLSIKKINFQSRGLDLPTSAVCCYIFAKMSGLIWIQSVWHSNDIPERNFWESWFWKNQLTTLKHAKLPSRQNVKLNQLSGRYRTPRLLVSWTEPYEILGHRLNTWSSYSDAAWFYRSMSQTWR